jgi:hypothetical protein
MGRSIVFALNGLYHNGQINDIFCLNGLYYSGSGVTTMGSDRANPGAPNHNEPNGGPQARAVEQKHWPGQGCIKYFIFWDHKANKNIFCMQTLGILCLNLITKQNSVHSMHHFIRFETKIDVFYPASSGF